MNSGNIQEARIQSCINEHILQVWHPAISRHIVTCEIPCFMEGYILQGV